MRHSITFAVLLAVANAYFDEFYFNTAANETCPGSPFVCAAPHAVCAHDQLLSKYYCCGSGEEDSVCWDANLACATSGGTLSASLQSCSNSGENWCCLSDREECTQKSGQVNICWSTESNPLANISNAVMNETYSSLLALHPNAKTLALNVSSLTAGSPSTSSSSSSTSSSSSSSATTASSLPETTSGLTADNDSGAGLSGGAIAGIVIGAIAGLALLIGATLFVLFRRRRQRNGVQAATMPASQDEKRPPVQEQYVPNNDIRGFYHMAEMPVEQQKQAELPAAPPSELPAGYDQHGQQGRKPDTPTRPSL